jgi:hypothetical protein
MSQPEVGNNVTFLSAAFTITPRKATPTDVIFMKRWGHCSLSSSFNTLSEENNRFCKKGQFINVEEKYSVNFRPNKYKFFL